MKNPRLAQLPKGIKAILLILMSVVVVVGTLTVALLLRMTDGQRQPMVAATKDTFAVEYSARRP